LFELGLEETPASLALVGSADPDDQKLMDEILRRSGQSDFAEEFLRAKGLSAQANMVARGSGSADATVAEAKPDPLSKIWGQGGQ
jgi:type IV secretion system protein VirB4